MSGSKPGMAGISAEATKSEWVDPDDAPELDEDFFVHADLYHGQTLIRRGRPRKARPKEAVSIRLSPDVLAAFRATGPGWQTRIDEALKEWLAQPRHTRPAPLDPAKEPT